jgi:hypothetical protein
MEHIPESDLSGSFSAISALRSGDIGDWVFGSDEEAEKE